MKLLLVTIILSFMPSLPIPPKSAVALVFAMLLSVCSGGACKAGIWVSIENAAESSLSNKLHCSSLQLPEPSQKASFKDSRRGLQAESTCSDVDSEEFADSGIPFAWTSGPRRSLILRSRVSELLVRPPPVVVPIGT